jgi:hypothetical protein
MSSLLSLKHEEKVLELKKRNIPSCCAAYIISIARCVTVLLIAAILQMFQILLPGWKYGCSTNQHFSRRPALAHQL